MPVLATLPGARSTTCASRVRAAAGDSKEWQRRAGASGNAARHGMARKLSPPQLPVCPRGRLQPLGLLVGATACGAHAAQHASHSMHGTACSTHLDVVLPQGLVGGQAKAAQRVLHRQGGEARVGRRGKGGWGEANVAGKRPAAVPATQPRPTAGGMLCPSTLPAPVHHSTLLCHQHTPPTQDTSARPALSVPHTPHPTPAATPTPRLSTSPWRQRRRRGGAPRAPPPRR